jgi:BirA family biotin operon repressor/biotin-[acetyl-CoA-carboxylase] ligase
LITRNELDRLARSLQKIESVAVMGTVASTNEVARRIVDECVENEIVLPWSIIIASTQTAGRGRGSRSWHSPTGGGIYATTLITTTSDVLQLLPLHAAVIVASFLREVFSLKAQIKWPNDIWVEGKKIAGILIDARHTEEVAFACIGTGINVYPVGPQLPEATSISEQSAIEMIDLDAAVTAFIEYVDASMIEMPRQQDVIEAWRRLSMHKPGDRIASVIGDKRYEGSWQGIDEYGRALIRQGSETIQISAGDLILVDERETKN